MDSMKAAFQWQTRPVDETFWGLSDARSAAEKLKATSREVETDWRDIRALAVDGDVKIVGKANVPANVSHYAFGQLARRIEAPADYLRDLPATLAAQNLNHGLAKLGSGVANLYGHKVNDTFNVASALTERYSRYYNADLLALLDDRLSPQGWRTPPARVSGIRANDPRKRLATEEDVIAGMQGGIQISVGDEIAPAGVYVSDHDMFALLILPNAGVEVPGSKLFKFAMFSNSEVGDRSLTMTMGYLDGVCGNHILWGVRDVQEASIRHVGDVYSKFHEVSYELRKYANEGTSLEAAKIVEAQRKLIAGTKDDVIDVLFGKRSVGLGRKLLTEAYEMAEATPRYGDPRSVWGMVNGLTEVSQKSGFQDQRSKIDKAAGKLMDVVF